MESQLTAYYNISIITHIASGLRVFFGCCKNGIKRAGTPDITKAEFQTVGALSMQNHALCERKNLQFDTFGFSALRTTTAVSKVQNHKVKLKLCKSHAD